MKQKTKKIISWAIQILLAFSFAYSVFTRELANNPDTLQHFYSFGFTKSFMRFIGIVELAGGIGLLIPYFVVLSSCGLFLIMMGATYSDLILAGDPWLTGLPSIITALFLVVIILLRWSIAGKRYMLPN